MGVQVKRHESSENDRNEGSPASGSEDRHTREQECAIMRKEEQERAKKLALRRPPDPRRVLKRNILQEHIIGKLTSKTP